MCCWQQRSFPIEPTNRVPFFQSLKN